ncbi:Neuferricin like [Pseudolycoriella hygida]|uniref:Neuferricin like n=1 Tax=Pseudolycoriella hygida TaxID=35572 RepID=A0A9Q0MVB0_9DIPT|nr:Neuferricin like [Pseudolycoriella hygida]
MISFFKEVIRQHYFILFVAIFGAFFWPEIKQNYYSFIINKTYQKSEEKTVSSDLRLFTKDELSKYDGEDNSLGLYLSILGHVYDVQKGRDASVSFISGNFDKIDDNIDDVLSLEPRDILSLKQWKGFYDKDYIFKGRLIGRYYDANGQETEYFSRVEEQINIAIENKRKEEMNNYDFPPCNIEWNANTGTKVWCTMQSGGVDRQWAGVPRKYFEAGQTSFRCACVDVSKLGHGSLKEYDGCDSNSSTCFYQADG